jgi:SAM-dependent methyltransferase
MTSREASVQDYWNRHSDLFSEYYKNPSWFDRLFRKAIFVRAMVAIDAARELPSPAVLDVGSGPGINSVALIKKGGARSVTGIDFAANMNDLAAQFARSEGVADRCEFLQGDFLEYPFEEKSFDLAIALGVFDYVAEAQRLLSKMASCARRTVVASWPQDGLRMRLRQARYTCPVYPYTEEQVRRLHENAGLERVRLVNVPGGWVSTAYTAR